MSHLQNCIPHTVIYPAHAMPASKLPPAPPQSASIAEQRGHQGARLMPEAALGDIKAGGMLSQPVPQKGL